ncbi:MAG: DUF262 domain-containing protein [Deltaproteobacteria bacterium]|nr:DUF262 domain-containing protein [Deltaproteobacteria bacterium]
MRTPDTLFQVSLNTVESAFSAAGRGFYVPPYQRHYSWGKQETDRLIQDLTIGLQSWVNDPDAVTFLGSIIIIKDELFDQVVPAIKDHLPGEVMVVIDGQQRLSTLTMLAIMLHAEVISVGEKVKRAPDFPGKGWILNRYEQTVHRLLPLFELDSGFGEWQFYPKIIRAYDDQWSRDPASAKYASPIARIINRYIKHHRSDTRSRFALVDNDPGHASVNAVAKQLRKHITKAITNGVDADGDPLFPPASELASDVQKHLFKDLWPEGFGDYLGGAPGSRAHSLLSLIAFSNYLLSRCSVTITRPMEDRFAFELFERLNTTGQQLTAYETFRPLVVRAEGLSEYRESNAHSWIREIDEFVPMDWKYDKRSRATNDLLLPYAMQQEGKKLPKRLGPQRNWLRTTFEALPDITAKRDFVLELRNLVRFLQNGFHYRSPAIPTSRLVDLSLKSDDLTIVCLDFISRANHDICVGPLSRFYSHGMQNASQEASDEFAMAAKACAAFFTLYRWAYGTSGIPDAYRQIMRIGDKKHNILPMGQLIDGGGLASGMEFSAYLGRKLLARVGGGRDEWIDVAKMSDIYRSSVLARFALFAAFEDTMADESTGRGVPRKGKRGCLEMLTLARWCEQPEVEHVAPQIRGRGWTDDLYEGKTINYIGNLVLLPKAANGSANNKSWEAKRLYYQVLGSPDRVADMLDSPEVQSLGVDLASLTPSTVKILSESKYYAYLKPIGDVEGTWDALLVQHRSERLAELVWDQLAPWLQLQ